MKQPRRPFPYAKYSLLVLAGVFALVGGLVALIDPPNTTLADFVQSAESAQCQANLHQIAAALSLYAQRYQGRLPLDSEHPTLAGSLKLLRWMADSPIMLHCPGDTRPGTFPASDFESLSISNISYTYVPYVSWAAGTGFGDSNKVVMLDRIYTGNAGDQWPPTGDHGDTGGWVLFADGRVEFYQVLPSTLTDDMGRKRFLSP